MIQFIRAHPLSPEERALTYKFMIAFGILFAGFFIYYSLKQRKNAAWREGNIPENFKFNRVNLFEFYIACAAAMVLREKEKWVHKKQFLKSFLQVEFKQEYSDISESYQFSLKHCLKSSEIVRWGNLHFDENQKIKLVTFLLNFALTDGVLVDNEREFLIYLIKGFEMNTENLDYNTRSSIFERPEQSATTLTKRDEALRILELPVDASNDEIKSRYREKVKEVHPDRFSNATESELEELKIRFQKIQDAYEYLLI